LADKSAFELVKDLASVPDDIRTAVQNNGGGHVNHSFFWEILAPNAGGAPTGAIGETIVAKFGDFDAFKETFKTAQQVVSVAAGHGW
jgi:Fe-Mn family superoxide dismutase